MRSDRRRGRINLAIVEEVWNDIDFRDHVTKMILEPLYDKPLLRLVLSVLIYETVTKQTIIDKPSISIEEIAESIKLWMTPPETSSLSQKAPRI